ncbi:MAG: AAA family ATPase [Candidatus Omnitrophica bacterium]|nr:AAA family ATPase [Candidatus Omnitrophota bacterium]
MARAEKEISILIRARYPIVSIVSYEEERIVRFLYKLTQEQNKQLYLWSASTGLHLYGQQKIDQASRDPLVALSQVEDSTGPIVFLFKDLHPYLSDPAVVRKLRDLVENLKSTYQTLILVSPVASVPLELEKDIAIVDFDLPDRPEISQLLDNIIKAVSERKEVRISLNAEIRERLIDAAQGLTYNEAENAFARAVVEDNALDERDIELVLKEKKQVIRKSGILDYFPTEETLETVGGLDNLKEWLRKRRQAFTQEAREFGLPEPRGILLVGVQGCGKSLTAKAVASFWKLPLLRFDVGRVFASTVGSSEENMRRAIKTAESIAPVILWIDEIEKSLSGSQSSSFSDAGTSARVFGTFVTWLQEKTRPVFVIATANNIHQLPPELLRKGRFDEIFFVDLPDFQERQAIFAIHLKKRKRDPKDFDLVALAEASDGFSGAEIEQAITSALFDVFVANQVLTTEDIKKSLRATVPLSQTMREEISSFREWAKARTVPASLQRKPPNYQERKLEFNQHTAKPDTELERNE